MRSSFQRVVDLPSPSTGLRLPSIIGMPRRSASLSGFLGRRQFCLDVILARTDGRAEHQHLVGSI